MTTSASRIDTAIEHRGSREVALRRRRSWQIIRSWVVHDDVSD